jgi:hypothetical protein
VRERERKREVRERRCQSDDSRTPQVRHGGGRERVRGGEKRERERRREKEREKDRASERASERARERIQQAEF